MKTSEILDYRVFIRILPSGREVEMTLPMQTTGESIKRELLNHEELALPKNDPEGNLITYKLTSKGSGREITDEVTVHNAGVRDGDTLLLAPVIIAG